MTVAKALLFLQRALQGRPAHQKETNYISLRDSFCNTLLNMLGKEVFSPYKQEDKPLEKKDLELLSESFKETHWDESFRALAETLRGHLWVHEAKSSRLLDKEYVL